MELTDKITSEAELKGILGLSSYNSALVTIANRLSLSADEVAWWAVREELRLLRGLYTTSSVLETLNKKFQVFAHVSLKDSKMVAFTPDKASGEADRQVVTSVGKLLSKYYVLYKDHVIADLAAEHESDISLEVEFVEGPAIAEVYKTCTITSCMTKLGTSGKDWATLGVDPLLAYDAEQIKLAVLRDKEGNINARCLVVHIDGEKRAIRAYGDLKLPKRLKNLGYQPGGWQNVKFRTIPIPHKEGWYAIPYLDQRGSAASSANSTVALVDGQVIGASGNLQSWAARNYLKVGSYCTSGAVQLDNIDSSRFAVSDDYTGASVNSLEFEMVEYWAQGDDGEPVQKLTAVKNAAEWRFCRYNGVSRRSPLAWATFDLDQIDTPKNRLHRGYIKLSAKLYPEKVDVWVAKWSTVELEVDGESHVVLSEDTTHQLVNGEAKHVLTVRLKPKMRKLAPDRQGKVCYYDHKVEKVFRTAAGKFVHPAFNDNIEKLWDGSYAMSRSAVCVNSRRGFESHYRLRKGTDQAAYQAWLDTKLEQEFEKRWADGITALGSWLYNNGLNFYAYGAHLGAHDGCNLWSVLRRKDDPARHAKTFVDRVREQDFTDPSAAKVARLLRLKLAEAYAEEAPERLPEQQTVETETFELAEC